MKKDRTQDVILGALQAQVISHLALTVGTMYGVNKAVFGAMVSNGSDIETSAIFAAIAAVPAGIAVDGSLKKWLPYVIAWITGKKDVDTGVERKSWLNWIIMLLCVAQLSVSTFLNFSVSPEIVEDAAGQINTEQYDRMADRATTRYEKDLERIEQGIESAEREVDKLTASEKSDMMAIITQRTNSEVAKLWARGNTWVSSPDKGRSTDCKGCAKAIAFAKKQVSRKIEAATAKLEKEQGRLSAYMDKSGSTLDSVTVATTGLTVATTNKHEEKKGRWTAVMVWFMALMAFTFVLSTVVVVVLEEETGSDFDSIPTAGNIASGVFKKAKNGVTKAFVKIFGLDKFTHAPTLAGVSQSIRIAPTQSSTAQKVRTEHRTQKENTESQNRTQKSCQIKTEKQDSDKQDQVRETQKSTETADTERNTEAVLYSVNKEGKEWPTPDNKTEWGKLVKKARQWAVQSVEAGTEDTRQKNAKRWGVFCEYAKQYGYRAGIGDAGKPFVNQDSEPTWSADGSQVVWDRGGEGDFDSEYTED